MRPWVLQQKRFLPYSGNSHSMWWDNYILVPCRLSIFIKISQVVCWKTNSFPTSSYSLPVSGYTRERGLICVSRLCGGLKTAMKVEYSTVIMKYAQKGNYTARKQYSRQAKCMQVVYHPFIALRNNLLSSKLLSLGVTWTLQEKPNDEINTLYKLQRAVTLHPSPHQRHWISLSMRTFIPPQINTASTSVLQ